MIMILAIMPSVSAWGWSSSRGTYSIRWAAEYKELIATHNDFAFRLFKNELVGRNGNILVSPINVAMMMSAVAEVSPSETKRDLYGLLGVHGSIAEEGILTDFYVSGTNLLLRNIDRPLESRLGGNVWVAPKVYARNRAYLEEFSHIPGFRVESGQLTMDEACDSVASWFGKEGGKTDICQYMPECGALDVKLASASLMRYVNDIRFSFDRPFSVDTFYCASGNRSLVKMGNWDDYFDRVPGTGYEMFCLETSHSDLIVYYLLPDRGVTLEECFKSLSLDIFNDRLSNIRARTILINLPVIDLSETRSLQEIAASFGLSDSLDSDAGTEANDRKSRYDYGPMVVRSDLAISMRGPEDPYNFTSGLDVVGGIPRPVQEYDESEVITLERKYMNPHPHFCFNKPFAVIVRDRYTGLIVFMGAVREL